jgi:P pilus assembly chaperone PapD
LIQNRSNNGVRIVRKGNQRPRDAERVLIPCNWC